MCIKHQAIKMLLLLLFVVVLAPLWVLFGSAMAPSSETWAHLFKYSFWVYVQNSLILACCVVLFAGALGVFLAWIAVFYTYPFKRTSEFLLLLPMAVPAYLSAYSYTGFLDYGGTLFVIFKLMNWQPVWFDLRTMGGAVLVLGLNFYPYVYLLMREAFLSQSSESVEVAKTFGYKPLDRLRRLLVPLARPALIAGVSIVIMETLSDYGVVQYFGIQTLTTGIFRTWYGLSDLRGATQLAVVLASFSIALFSLERFSRRTQRYYENNTAKPMLPMKLGKISGVVALLCVLMPVVFGFGIPFVQIIYWNALSLLSGLNVEFFKIFAQSIQIGVLGSLFILSLSLLLSYAQRYMPSMLTKILASFSGFGYAMPGTVVMIGAILLLGFLNQYIHPLHFLLTASVFGLILAYSVRFLYVSLQPIQSSLGRMSPSLDEAAQTLGYGKIAVVRSVHWPLLKSSLAVAFMLTFSDILKELPITLVLRPFNYQTLAVYTYELASDEQLVKSGLPALGLLLAGMMSVFVVSRMIKKV